MSSTRRHAHIALLFVALMPLLLGCEWLLSLASSPVSSTIPRWACPTPTPKPYGDDGPVKGYHDGAPDPTTGIPKQEPEYYEKWEQEYGNLGGPPFPAPTPYTKSGTVFYLGQLVNLANGAVDMQLSIESTGIMSGTDQLYRVKIDWHNRGDAFPFVAARQIAISEIQQPNGRKAANTWITNDAAIRLAGLNTEALLRQDIPPGNTEQIVPILAPLGTVQTAEARLDIGTQAEGLRVRFISAQESHCDEPGTENAHYDQAAQGAIPPAVPPGTDGVIAFALNQVGRPYCWGGKGNSPCAGNPIISYADRCPDRQGLPCWDCSGLTWGAYNSVGVIIGHGTSNQSHYIPVPIEQIQPGDLMLFSDVNANGRGARITHVGLYAGDVTGDGTGDLVHAANYPDGVIISNNVLGNRYYRSHLVVITRPSRG
jgi:cell wall-associated NlpC family hydrolase